MQTLRLLRRNSVDTTTGITVILTITRSRTCACRDRAPHTARAPRLAVTVLTADDAPSTRRRDRVHVRTQLDRYPYYSSALCLMTGIGPGHVEPNQV